MIQINLLFIHLDVHLHRDQFEIFCIILPQVLHVMITGYEIDFPIQPFEYLCPFSRATKTEVAKMKYDIIRTDHTVPVGNKCFIHVFYILEWSATEPDDIGMIEVGIGCKEHLTAIKFIVHFFAICVHHCTLIIRLPTAHQTEMAEEHHKGDCHKWAYKQNSWKAW